MFNIKIKSEFLKGFINILSSLVSEAKFSFTEEDGINIKAMDSSHIALIEINIYKDSFDFYESQNIELGVNLEKLKDIIKLTTNNDIIILSQEENKSIITITINNLTRTICSLDLSNFSKVKIPQLSFSSKIVLNSSDLQKAIKASESFSDHLIFETTENRLLLSSKGSTDTMSLKLEKSSLQEFISDGFLKSIYPLNYLSSLIKSLNDSTSLSIELNSNYPLKISFSLSSCINNISYYLAPRLDENS